MKKRILSLLLTLVLCLGLTVPALAAEDSKFEELSIAVMQETPKELPLTYVNYVWQNPDDLVVRNGYFTIDNCTVTPAKEKNYQDVTLKVTAHLEYYCDEETGTYYDSSMWTNGVYDYYTGIYFNFGGMDGDTRRDITTTVPFNGRNYKVSCSKSNEWTHYGLDYNEKGELVDKVTCESTLVFTVPETYNGLVYGLYEKAELTKEDLEFSAPSGRAVYVEKEDGDNAVFFRFGHTTTKNLPRNGLVLSVFDQGDNKALGYTVSNHGTERVTGYYALLSYWPETDYHAPTVIAPTESEHFRGQILPLDIDLAPGRSMSGDCEAVATGWSTMTHKWIKFDSKAERDAFFKASVLENTFGVYEIDDGAAGIRWMKDTFGITIRSGKN